MGSNETFDFDWRMESSDRVRSGERLGERLGEYGSGNMSSDERSHGIYIEYSLLPEVYIRGDSTLEVRQSYTPLEVRRSHPGLEAGTPDTSSPHSQLSKHNVRDLHSPDGSSPRSTLAPSVTEKQKHSKRFWILLSVAGLLIAGAIAGSIAGTLLAKSTTTSIGSDADSKAGSSNTTSGTAPSPDLPRNQTTPTTSTTPTAARLTTLIPTATPSLSQAPLLPIRIGNILEGQDFTSAIAYIDDNSTSAACRNLMIARAKDENPCARPFRLADGFEYTWMGCGNDTWMTWRNPKGSPKFEILGGCLFEEETFNCDGTTIKGAWRCARGIKVPPGAGS